MSCPEYRHEVCQRRQVVATTPSSDTDMKNSFYSHPQSLTLNVYASKVCLRVGSTSPDRKKSAFLNTPIERNFGYCDDLVDISHLKCQCKENLGLDAEKFKFWSFSNW